MGTFEMSQSAWVKYCEDMKALRAENDRLTAEFARLKAALSKYADDANWYGDILDGYKDCWVKNENGYNIARAALAESEPK